MKNRSSFPFFVVVVVVVVIVAWSGYQPLPVCIPFMEV